MLSKPSLLTSIYNFVLIACGIFFLKSFTERKRRKEIALHMMKGEKEKSSVRTCIQTFVMRHLCHLNPSVLQFFISNRRENCKFSFLWSSIFLNLIFFFVASHAEQCSTSEPNLSYLTVNCPLNWLGLFASVTHVKCRRYLWLSVIGIVSALKMHICSQRQAGWCLGGWGRGTHSSFFILRTIWPWNQSDFH